MPTRPFDWVGRRALYRDPLTGRFISRADVRRWLDRFIALSQARIRGASDQLRAGTLDLAEWQAAMREEIKRTHLSAEMLLRGGRRQMTQADFGRVGQRVREQYAYLAKLTDDLRSNRIRTDGGFLNRATMYASSARVGYHESERAQLAGIGFTEERNLLAPAEHCLGCIEETRRGWVPIGELVPIGQRDCLGNDKCAIEYR